MDLAYRVRLNSLPYRTVAGHFGAGLVLGLAVLILLHAFYQPTPRSFAQDVAVLGHSLHADGSQNPRQVGAVLHSMRAKGNGRIAWIQLRNEEGAVIAQAGRSAPLEHAAAGVVLKSYRLQLPSGFSGTLDVAFRTQQAKRTSFSAL